MTHNEFIDELIRILSPIAEELGLTAEMRQNSHFLQYSNVDLITSDSHQGDRIRLGVYLKNLTNGNSELKQYLDGKLPSRDRLTMGPTVVHWERETTLDYEYAVQVDGVAVGIKVGKGRRPNGGSIKEYEIELPISWAQKSSLDERDQTLIADCYKRFILDLMPNLQEGRERLFGTECGMRGPIINVHEERKIRSTKMDMNEEIKKLLTNVGQVILHGAPGTGKTYTAMQIAAELTGDDLKSEKQEHIKKVQFHSGYDYSDFVLGLKPKLVGPDGHQTVSFEWKAGVFKEFVDKAQSALDAAKASALTEVQKFVFVIDEINRADLSRVFGELFSLIEMDYRYPKKQTGITLPNGGEMVIPDNLYIIGTMNDIDRSVESMDFALRRRFAWQEIDAESSEVILDAKIKDPVVRKKLKKAMRAVNGIIGDQEKSRLGHDYQIGGAIFANFLSCADDAAPYDSLWNVYIKTIVNEYLRGNRDKDKLIGDIKDAYDKALQET